MLSDTMGRWAEDIRQCSRALAAQPGYALAIVCTLAIAIGLSTAIFSVVHGLLLKPLPFEDPSRVVLVREVTASGQFLAMSEPNFDDLAERTQSFAALGFSLGSVSLVVTGGSEPVRARVSYASPEFFDVLRVYPVVGRTFVLEETQPRGLPAVIVSHTFWQRLLDGNDRLQESWLTVDGVGTRVVGVMPPGFGYPGETEIWLTRSAEPPSASRTAHSLAVVGRLRDGVSRTLAQAELTTIGTALRAELGDATDAVDLALVDVQTQLTSTVREALWLLLGAVALLLLVACANVANLVLARFLGKQREFAMRRALGATRLRLAQRFIAEQLVLTLPAAMIGVLLAEIAVRALLMLEGGGVLPRFNPVNVDWRVLWVVAAVAALICVTIGAMPAIRLGAEIRSADLRAGAASLDRAAGRFRNVLLLTQVGLTTALLVCAGVLARGYLSLLSVDPGFDPRNAVALTLGLPSNVSAAQDEELRSFYVQLLERIGSLPGVLSVGGINSLPLSGAASSNAFTVDGDQAHRGTASYRIASPGYFAAMRIPLLSGRLFDSSDTVESPHVAVISESMARQLSVQDPIGRVLDFNGLGGDRRPVRVIGIVGDVRIGGLDAEPGPAVYAYSLQRPQWWQVSRLAIVVRTAADPRGLVPAMRAEVESLRSGVPIAVRTLSEVSAGSLAQRRFSVVLFGVFGVTAVVIAGLGVFAVVSYAVNQRARELAIRGALGATRRQLTSLVMRHGLGLVATGLIAGLALGAAATQLLANLVYGEYLLDAATLGAVAVLLMTIAVVACWFPARRVLAIEPHSAVRVD